jgi:site-specific recombinase XerD
MVNSDYKHTVYIHPCDDVILAVRIPYDRVLYDAIQKIPYKIWDSHKMTWFIKDRKEYLDLILESALSRNYSIYIGQEAADDPPDRDLYSALLKNLAAELTVRKYSTNTIKCYMLYNTELLMHSRKEPGNITQDDITSFLSDNISVKKYSTATVQLIINSLRFYYGEVLKRDFIYEIKPPSKDKKLPVVLSRQEVMRIFDNVNNLKHRTILMLIYSAGLRLNEAITMKRSDIDTDRGVISIRKSKGRKDRTTLLAGRFRDIFVKYIAAYSPGCLKAVRKLSIYLQGLCRTCSAALLKRQELLKMSLSIH